MDPSSAPVCPACGFRIFNRRYPKCESCGAALPQTLAYTAAERRALMAAEDERERAEARARDARPEANSAGDGAILAAVLTMTSPGN